MKYPYLPVRMATTQTTDTPEGWEACGAAGTRVPCWWGCEMLQPLWKAVCPFLTKLNISCTWPVLVLLGIYPNEWKTHVHTNTCTWMFTAAVIATAKARKENRCPLVGKWESKLLYVHTIKYYPAIKQINNGGTKSQGWTLNACC